MDTIWYNTVVAGVVLLVALGVAFFPVLTLANEDNGATGSDGSAVMLDDPLQGQTFENLIENVLDFFQRIAIPLGVIFIVWAGIKFLTSRGNEQQVTEAKKALTYAVVGVAVILIGRGLIAVVLDILRRGAEGQ